MKFNIFKIIIIIIFFLYQSLVYSKTNDIIDFNQRYLSNYFSALLAYDNQKNEDALKYFNSSKYLLNKHDKFLEEYVLSLVVGGKVSKAIKQIKYSKKINNINFFEANLLLLVDSLAKKDFTYTSLYLSKLDLLKNYSKFEFAIYETLKEYTNLFKDQKIPEYNVQSLGKLDLITKSFQSCYLNEENTESLFLNLINSPDGDYSRYKFFYLTHIVEKKEYLTAKQIASTIDTLSSSLLISQAKTWIDKSNFSKFGKIFSCKNESDILSEFFFLISNLYSSQAEYEKSNFYLNISNYLNPKFYYNLSLLIENYYDTKNYNRVKKILEKFDKKDEIYYWYKIKRIAQIISKEQNKEKSLNYIENYFNKIENPNIKILFDIGSIYKNYKKYEKAIKYFSIVLSKLNIESSAYAETLFRRGGSFERLGEFEKSDIDLIKSLEINPNDPYVMNYLAYSWLERKYKIEDAIEMLEEAYKQEQNDPYIIDSVGWGYFLIGDYINAEIYLKRAVQLLPEDPVINDHYGDILWMLNRKLQAKYFWENVLFLKDVDDNLKKNIQTKLLNGLNKI